MPWRIEVSQTAARQIAKLDPATAARIVSFLRESLAGSDDPRGLGTALAGPLGGLRRYRVGDYRLICDIQDNAVRVLVLRVGHRGGGLPKAT